MGSTNPDFPLVSIRVRDVVEHSIKICTHHIITPSPLSTCTLSHGLTCNCDVYTLRLWAGGEREMGRSLIICFILQGLLRARGAPAHLVKRWRRVSSMIRFLISNRIMAASLSSPRSLSALAFPFPESERLPNKESRRLHVTNENVT